MAGLRLEHIYKIYPGGVAAVKDFHLEIFDKEFLIFVGPSGCGKSTTLRMIAGLEEISEGELYIGDRLVNDVPPKDRDIAMVFQNYALYPHMTVYDNMAFGLKLRKMPKAEIKARVEEAARILDISHLLERRPKALSGGQRQRVALGRAIVRNPKVFLLDEPLSNLDAKLRTSMRSELTKLHKKLGTTFIYVTHDQIEAMTMASRIVVMKDGIIQQVDTPQNLYEHPCNLFVAGFIGTPQMNFVNGTLVKEGDNLYATIGSSKILLPAEKAKHPALEEYYGKEVIFGIRPETIHDEPMYLETLSSSTLKVGVDVTELMGSETYLYLTFDGMEDATAGKNIIAKVSSRSRAVAGDEITVAIDASRIHIFDKETEQSILDRAVCTEEPASEEPAEEVCE